MTFAVMFPGQGSQKVGMGLDLVEKSETARNIINQTDTILGRKLSDIFLYGPQEELNQTKNTQVAIVTISCILTLLLEEELKIRQLEFNPIFCMGHSLGEFTALWYVKILSFEELIKLVSIRGNLMQNSPPGAMSAILGVTIEQIQNLINESGLGGKIIIANYNSPTQFVISGEKEAVHIFSGKISDIGSAKAIILPVSGAFHSQLMEEPSKHFKVEIDKLFSLKDQNTSIKIPVCQNFDGKSAKDLTVIQEKIKKQMTSPVLWTQTINNLVSENISSVVEIGPGKVLTGLVKKINQNLDCYNISDYTTLNQFIENYEHKLLQTESTKTS